MAGTSLIAPATDSAGAAIDYSSNAVGFDVPVVRGIQGVGLLGGTLAKSLINLAPITSPSAPVAVGTGGAIQASSPLYGTLTNANNINTKVGDATQMSFFGVVRVVTQPAAVTTANSLLVSSEGASAGFGLSISSIGLGLSVRGNTTSARIATAYNAWIAIAATVNSSGLAATIYNLSAGTSQAYVLTAALVPNGSLYVGGSPWTSLNTNAGTTDVALWEVHNVVLTLSELQTIYAGYKPALAARGMTVV